jgi:hypothetical protein
VGSTVGSTVGAMVTCGTSVMVASGVLGAQEASIHILTIKRINRGNLRLIASPVSISVSPWLSIWYFHLVNVKELTSQDRYGNTHEIERKNTN